MTFVSLIRTKSHVEAALAAAFGVPDPSQDGYGLFESSHMGGREAIPFGEAPDYLFSADAGMVGSRASVTIMLLCDTCGREPQAYSGECYSHKGTVMAPEVCCSMGSECQELQSDSFEEDLYDDQGYPGDYEMYGPDPEFLRP